ncbi:MAG TPA: hypothetical protein VGK67_24150 [Myxococcales bacterium]|jgi:hypothetical protein
MRRLMLVLALSALSVPAFAQDPAAADTAKPDPEVDAAKAVLKQYLDSLVKAGSVKKPKAADVAKSLQAAKKFIHPKTLELIAGQEKKNLAANAMNALGTWNHAKEDYWLKSYEIGEARKAEFGSVVVDVSEKNWRVAEGGEDGEFESDSYLLTKVGAKWVLVDKRRNETFTDKAIKVGYKEYFDAGEKKEEKKEPAKEEAK